MSLTLRAIVIAALAATPALAVPSPQEPPHTSLACQLFVGAPPSPAIPTPGWMEQIKFRGRLADCHATGVIDVIAVDRAWQASAYSHLRTTLENVFPKELSPNWIRVNGELTWPAPTISFVDDELTWNAQAEILVSEPLQLLANTEGEDEPDTPLPRPRLPNIAGDSQDDLARLGPEIAHSVNRQITALCRERPFEAFGEATKAVVRGQGVPRCISRQVFEQQRLVTPEQGFNVVAGAIAAPFLVIGDLFSRPFRER